jgi:hypothetical protein
VTTMRRAGTSRQSAGVPAADALAQRGQAGGLGVLGAAVAEWHARRFLHQRRRGEIGLADVQEDHRAPRPWSGHLGRAMRWPPWRTPSRRTGRCAPRAGRSSSWPRALPRRGRPDFRWRAAASGAQAIVEHAVDVLVAVGAAEGLGQFDRIVDDHAVGHVQAVRQLVGADHSTRARWATARSCGPARPAPRPGRRLRRCSRAAARRSARVALVKAVRSRMKASMAAASLRPTSHWYSPAAQIRASAARAIWRPPCARRWLGPLAGSGCGGSVCGRVRQVFQQVGHFHRHAGGVAALFGRRAQACASFSTVRMALAMGIWWSSDTRVTPAPLSLATSSKW